MHPLTKQGVRDLDAIDRARPYVPPTLTEHVCDHWRWFHPPKGASEEEPSEILCVVCRKPWHGVPTGAVPPQVKSIEKLAPSLAKPKKKEKVVPMTAPTLKASATSMHDTPARRAR